MSTEILIIDDNADIRNIINDLIIEAGLQNKIGCKLQSSFKLKLIKNFPMLQL